MFQSTHPHGVRPGYREKNKKALEFQSTHPHGVRLTLKITTRLCFWFQSTHPHGVRRLPALPRAQGRFVSIHAPARGATGEEYDVQLSFTVSIHAPARGATRTIWLPFQSCRFQSTHPHGVRLGPDGLPKLVKWFQSTHPHGVRRLQR